MAGKETKKKKYSYIKKSFCRNGWYSFFLGIFVLLLTGGTLGLAIGQNGEAGMTFAALGLTGLLFALMGLWFTVLSFREAGRSYVFACIGGVLCGVCLLLWLLIAAVGVRL